MSCIWSDDDARTLVSGSEVAPSAWPLCRPLRTLVFVYPPYLLITVLCLSTYAYSLIAGILLTLHRASFAVHVLPSGRIYSTWKKASGTPILMIVRPPPCTFSISVMAFPLHAALRSPRGARTSTSDSVDPSPASRKGKDQEKSKPGTKKWMKGTAAWRWEEPEWKVVVRKEGTPSKTRVERPLTSLVEEDASAGANEDTPCGGQVPWSKP